MKVKTTYKKTGVKSHIKTVKHMQTLPIKTEMGAVMEKNINISV